MANRRYNKQVPGFKEGGKVLKPVKPNQKGLKKLPKKSQKQNGLYEKRRQSLMAKLCPKGKAAAKRKFKVYPSAYANMYASGVCSGKITPGGKKKKRTKACLLYTSPSPRDGLLSRMPSSA